MTMDRPVRMTDGIEQLTPAVKQVSRNSPLAEAWKQRDLAYDRVYAHNRGRSGDRSVLNGNQIHLQHCGGLTVCPSRLVHLNGLNLRNPFRHQLDVAMPGLGAELLNDLQNVVVDIHTMRSVNFQNGICRN